MGHSQLWTLQTGFQLTFKAAAYQDHMVLNLEVQTPEGVLIEEWLGLWLPFIKVGKDL